MAGLTDFSDAALNDGVDVANLPKEGRGAPPPPPMGAYVFALSPLDLKNFGKMTSDKYGERAYVNFNQDAPLVIVQSVGGKHDGEPVRTLLNNQPRPRGKGPDAPVAADWDYLNAALGINLPKRTNKAYVEGLIAASKTRGQFGASIEYGWQCDDNRDAYFPTETEGHNAPIPDANQSGQNVKGCGARYYAGQDWKAPGVDEATGQPNKAGAVGKTANVEGGYDYRAECQHCGAIMRAQVNLAGFRKAGAVPVTGNDQKAAG